jgi:hypothetical protein
MSDENPIQNAGVLGDLESTAAAASSSSQNAAGGATIALFTLATFVSAALLFSIQPMFAKMALPVLGGSPSVWAVALCFFQAALLAGYCYAHILIRWFDIQDTGWIHLTVCLAAALFLPIALPASAGEPPTGDAYLWQLGLFSLAIGLPFVAVAANAPLIQAWFARTGHAEGRDPYFLYAASNLGSLLSLLGYPLVLEPAFGLKALSFAWSIGFGALILLLGLCFLDVRLRADAVSLATMQSTQSLDDAPSWRERLSWIWLSLVPAGLLTAFTTHVATDVASAPLIWVIPLSLYLLTFVLVFRDRALVPLRILLPLQLVAVVLALLHLSQIKHESIYISASLGVMAFFTSALVAHRTLYEARPDAQHLTEFYLFMSLGGALGGIFASLLAPKIFPEVFEYPLLLSLTMACRPGVLNIVGESRKSISIIAGLLAVLGVLLLALSGWASNYALAFNGWGIAPFAVTALSVFVILAYKWPVRQSAAALAIVLALIFLPSATHRGAAERSYFGVYRVVVSEDGDFNVLQHGTTLHGAQRIRDEKGNAVKDIFPVTYYHPKSPMAQSVAYVRFLLNNEGRKGRYGVIGLGAGALACHSMEGEAWRFYEIDPVVVDIAKSEKFTFLSSCQPNADIVIGDARLTIAREKESSFDLLIVDAFSSDAVPMHLLTAEALKLYLSKLTDQGVVVLHTSNRYLDLEAVLQATLAEAGIKPTFAIVDPTPDNGYAVTRSTVVVFGKDPRVVHQFLRVRGARTLNFGDLKPWTDDSSEILGPILSRLRNVQK